MSRRSCNGDPKLKYQGFQQNYTSEAIQTTITYQSNREALENNIVSTTGIVVGDKWKCGNQYTYGRLDSINLQDSEGPFWNATLTFSQPLSSGLIVNMGGDNKNATNNSLVVRMISMPIESHPNYSYIWNHILARLGAYEDGDYDIQAYGGENGLSGLTVEQAKVLVNRSEGKLKWLNDASELPTEAVTYQNEGSDDIFTDTWNIAQMSHKPGVEYYEFPTYEITEYTRHKDRNSAAWAIAQKSGKIKFPQYGDFGLEDKFPTNAGGYRWLCLGGQINFDGKYFIAQCSFEWSPDPDGWDQQMYDVADPYGKTGKGANPIL